MQYQKISSALLSTDRYSNSSDTSGNRWKLTAPALKWLATVILLFLPSNARSQAEFYNNKTIQVVVGYPPGGGFDNYARLIVRHLGKYVPGSPNVVALNMPGADTVRMANYIFNSAPQDGTVLGMPSHALILSEGLWKDDGVKFDSAKLNWIGRISPIDLTMVAWHKTGVKNIEDVKSRDLIIASTSTKGTVSMVPMALNRMIGTRFKLVQGYTGSADQLLAMERGEVEGMGNLAWSEVTSRHPKLITEKQISVLYIIGLQRLRILPEVPTIVELAQNDDDRRVMRLLASTSEIGRSFLTGPHVAKERVALLRRAFQNVFKDEALVEESKKLLLDLDPMAGEDLQSLVAEVMAFPKSTFDYARRIVAAD